MEFPQSAMTPENFDTIAAIDALLSPSCPKPPEQKDGPCRSTAMRADILDMLEAAGQSRGRYDDVEERRQSLINLADVVDPPGEVAIGGVRDELLAVDDRPYCAQGLFALGKAGARIARHGVLSRRRMGGGRGSTPMTDFAAAFPTNPDAA